MSKTTNILAAISFTAFASAAYALPASANESADIDAIDGRHPTIETIVRNWDQYGFVAPVKPAQMSVNGRDGVSISGTDYATALSILRKGAVPMREGRSAVSIGGARHRTGQ